MGKWRMLKDRFRHYLYSRRKGVGRLKAFYRTVIRNDKDVRLLIKSYTMEKELLEGSYEAGR